LVFERRRTAPFHHAEGLSPLLALTGYGPCGLPKGGAELALRQPPP
jgi:hypothetical protein